MRKIELAVVACLLGGCRAASVDVVEQPIVGGTLTTGYPFVGYLSADYGGGTSSGCTGTLIRDKWFLTASHCIEADMGPVLGAKVTFEADSDNATSWHMAKSWTQHPNYGKPIPPDTMYFINRGYDCALIELDTPVSGVTPINYNAAAMTSSWVGTAVTQIGYGFTSGNGTGSGQKRELATTIADVHDGVLGLAANGTGTCQGDSGGPTLYDTGGGVLEVIGVSSYGDPGCPGGGWMSRTELCAAWLDSMAGPAQAPPDLSPPPAPADMAGTGQPGADLSPPGSGDPGNGGGGSAGGGNGVGGVGGGGGENNQPGASGGCQLGDAPISAAWSLLALALLLLFTRRAFR
jgi:secreted trypsin-like serine protease